MNVGDVVEHKADGRRMVVTGFGTAGFWRPRAVPEEVCCEFPVAPYQVEVPIPGGAGMPTSRIETRAYERQSFAASSLRAVDEPGASRGAST